MSGGGIDLLTIRDLYKSGVCQHRAHITPPGKPWTYFQEADARRAGWREVRTVLAWSIAWDVSHGEQPDPNDARLWLALTGKV